MQHVGRLLYHRDRWVGYFAGRSQSRSGFSHTQKRNGGRSHGGVPGRKTKDYTIMSNHHLKDRRLSLKAKGLLSMMLSLPKEWDYTLKGLARISREGVDAIRECGAGTGSRPGMSCAAVPAPPKDSLANAEYVIYEHPIPASRSALKPAREKPVLENPTQEKPAQEDPTQLKKQESNTNPEKTKPIASIHPILPESASWTAAGRGWNIRSSMTRCWRTRA